MYWIAESTGLGGLTEPLFDWMEVSYLVLSLLETGANAHER